MSSLLYSEFGSADEANKKSHSQVNYLYSQKNSVAQGLKVDDKEPSRRNSCESFDSTNEDSKGGVFVPSASKKQKLHWGYNSNSTFFLLVNHYN